MSAARPAVNKSAVLEQLVSDHSAKASTSQSAQDLSWRKVAASVAPVEVREES